MAAQDAAGMDNEQTRLTGGVVCWNPWFGRFTGASCSTDEDGIRELVSIGNATTSFRRCERALDGDAVRKCPRDTIDLGVLLQGPLQAFALCTSLTHRTLHKHTDLAPQRPTALRMVG